MPTDTPRRYVSRAGFKLEHALDQFDIQPTGWVCADLGSHTGGFVDCLLQNEAAKVFAVDTGAGTLAWTLRNDPRVTVMERTSALHAALPERVALVTIDVGWTKQHLVLPRAIEFLAPGGRIITLIKPHYESDRRQLAKGVLPDELVEPTVRSVVDHLANLSITIARTVDSPIRGDAGNREILALIET